jgi:hypothetical protein
MANSLIGPLISSVFKAIRRNETLELRLEKFSKYYPDWEGPAAFVEGCGTALQALMQMTNNRCCSAQRRIIARSSPVHRDTATRRLPGAA